MSNKFSLRRYQTFSFASVLLLPPRKSCSQCRPVCNTKYAGLQVWSLSLFFPSHFYNVLGPSLTYHSGSDRIQAMINKLYFYWVHLMFQVITKKLNPVRSTLGWKCPMLSTSSQKKLRNNNENLKKWVSEQTCPRITRSVEFCCRKMLEQLKNCS